MSSSRQRAVRRSVGAAVGAALSFGVALSVGLVPALPAHAQAGSPADSQVVTMSTANVPQNSKQAALYTVMRSLWEQHMEWTHATVDAFADGSGSTMPFLHRLLQDQADIGNAIKPFYGDQAGDRLTALLKQHILDAVPVLEDAKAGDQAALQAAVAAWYANAKEIADFLAAANPYWSRTDLEAMMQTHITQTIDYSVDALKGDWTANIEQYDQAEAHMMQMADMLSRGIVLQFPKKVEN
ncbi:MAG TPA: hypothetical protein VFI30_02710 [Nocardioidaceae bacterium]|nr:hypothetical protein [Nocardioidaceae bacterium]